MSRLGGRRRRIHRRPLHRRWGDTAGFSDSGAGASVGMLAAEDGTTGGVVAGEALVSGGRSVTGRAGDEAGAGAPAPDDGGDVRRARAPAPGAGSGRDEVARLSPARVSTSAAPSWVRSTNSGSTGARSASVDAPTIAMACRNSEASTSPPPRRRVALTGCAPASPGVRRRARGAWPARRSSPVRSRGRRSAPSVPAPSPPPRRHPWRCR